MREIQNMQAGVRSYDFPNSTSFPNSPNSTSSTSSPNSTSSTSSPSSPSSPNSTSSPIFPNSTKPGIMKNYKDLIKELNPKSLPKHIAIIMDGNGRWAKKHKTKKFNGHKAGVTALRKIVEASDDINLKYLTVYAFSTENWRRSNREVDYLLKLIMDSLLKEINELIENNVNIRFIGSEKKLEKSYSRKVLQTCKQSWSNDGLHLNIAMNYGGRKELIEGFERILLKYKKGEIDSENIDEKLISNTLYTAGMPDPDLIIRTSGEQRLSNFLIWQSAYSELWFTKTLWPDFGKQEFLEAVMDYQKRQRRFGARK